MLSPQNPRNFAKKARIASAAADFLKNLETRAQPRESLLFLDFLQIFSMLSPQNPQNFAKKQGLPRLQPILLRFWPKRVQITERSWL